MRRQIDLVQRDLMRAWQRLPHLPRYAYVLLAGVGALFMVALMSMCVLLAVLANSRTLATPTPDLPTSTAQPAVTCDDPLAPDAQWQVEGANCVLNEEKVDGASTSTLDMSYPYDLIAQYPFTKPSLLNILDPIRDGFWQSKAENPGDPNDITSSWSMQVTAETTAFSATVFSVLFRVSAYTGGAHPYSELHTVTFDFANQTVLTLSDLFQEGVNPYPIIAPLARVQLLTAMPELGDFIDTGTAPTADNYRSWGLTVDSLVVYFDQGQAGPSAAGTQTVTIPLASLADSLKPEFVPGQ